MEDTAKETLAEPSSAVEGSQQEELAERNPEQAEKENHANDSISQSVSVDDVGDKKDEPTQEIPVVAPSTTVPAAESSSDYPKIVVLVSNSSGSLQQRTNQDRAMSILKGKVTENLQEIDGSNPANKERRNELFGVSGIRAQYPQFFLQRTENEVTFLGDFEWLDFLNETGGLNKAAIFGDSTEVE